jgi:hypothetical protein
MKRQTELENNEPPALRRLYLVGADPGAEPKGRRRAVAVPLKRLARLPTGKSEPRVTKPSQG